MRAETRRQSLSCLTSYFSLYAHGYKCPQKCQRVSLKSIDLGVTNKCKKAGEITNMESMNNEDGLRIPHEVIVIKS
jgi:hypothetical protein